jgi:hypothetical protein
MRIAPGIALAMLAAGAPAARADFPSDVPDRFKIQAGGVKAQFDTQASMSLTDGPAGVYVNFEDVFDLPVRDNSWSVEGFYRFSDKGYVDFGYVDYRRQNARVLEQDVEWGEYVFQANARVDAKFNTTFPYAAYRHDFLQLEQVHISGSAGISFLILGAGLEADGGVVDQNGQPVTGSVEVEADVAFPVPLLGLQLDWRLTRHTALQFYGRTLYVDYQQFRGGLNQQAIRYEWYATRHFALGGGISFYRINIQRYETGDYTARFQYSVSGPELYLKMAF